MQAFLKKPQARVVLATVGYNSFIPLVITPINGYLFKYLDTYLPTLMAEHAVIGLLTGIFWKKISGLKGKAALLTVLIPPTVYFFVALVWLFVTGELDWPFGWIMFLFAISQYGGVLIGRGLLMEFEK